MNTATAAVFDAGRLELVSLAVPEPADGEILIALEACTLCASDLHTLAGRRATETPLVLGHEAVGRIAAWGPDRPESRRQDDAGEPLGVGDRVTWSIASSCGRCFYCRRDLPQKCLRLSKFGHHPAPSRQPQELLRGGLASHCLLAPGTSLFKAPDDLPLGAVCPANCATATVAAALESADAALRPAALDAAAGSPNMDSTPSWEGREVLVVGAGMLGLTAIAMLRDLGARVVAADRSPQRLEIAEQFGAEPARNSSGASLPAMHEGHGADCLLEMTGSPAALAGHWPQLRIGGAAVLVGSVFPSPPFPLDTEQLVRRLQTVRGVHNYAPRHLLQALRFLRGAGAKMEQLVTRWSPLASIDEAVEEAGSGRHVRVGVLPSGDRG